MPTLTQRALKAKRKAEEAERLEKEKAEKEAAASRNKTLAKGSKSGAGAAEDWQWRTPRKWKRAEKAEEWRVKELERLNSTKYHYLKFVEKKKVERKLKRAKNMLEKALKEQNEEEAASLREELKSHLADHEYIEYYPKHLPYNALFPVQDSEASRKRRDEIRKMVRAAREKGGSDAGQKADRFAMGADFEDEDSQKPAKASNKAKKAKQKLDEAPGKKGKKGAKAKVNENSAEVKVKSKKRKEAPLEEDEANEAEVSTKPKLKKLKQTKKEDESVHPSWGAAKSAKVSGAIVKGKSKASKVFDDSDGEE
eukprot:TRINITY_DN15389_c0_g1_i1.p1 TRINITY_DN15389_c0_g1~~TRINITY_DN15389_c0_g1_i1.p1  ORF type:complete len:310 (+),score=97.05 TRINITY_DN15389_c0_g1_i1:106-1035(+)